MIPDDFATGDYYISPEKFETMRRYEVRPGDLLISVMGTVGKAAVVPENVEPGIINPRLVLYRVNRAVMSARFLQAFILSESGQAPLLESAQGSTMDGLNMGIIGELRVPTPPMREQDEILRVVRSRAGGIDRVRQKVLLQVDRLREYRQAVITAAVTGQLNVSQAGADTAPMPAKGEPQLGLFGGAP